MKHGTLGGIKRKRELHCPPASAKLKLACSLSLAPPPPSPPSPPHRARVRVRELETRSETATETRIAVKGLVCTHSSPPPLHTHPLYHFGPCWSLQSSIHTHTRKVWEAGSTNEHSTHTSEQPRRRDTYDTSSIGLGRRVEDSSVDFRTTTVWAGYIAGTGGSLSRTKGFLGSAKTIPSVARALLHSRTCRLVRF